MSPAGKSPLFLALEHNRYHLALLLLRYGATIPPHSTEKERFLRFVGDDANPDKVYDLNASVLYSLLSISKGHVVTWLQQGFDLSHSSGPHGVDLFFLISLVFFSLVLFLSFIFFSFIFFFPGDRCASIFAPADSFAQFSLLEHRDPAAVRRQPQVSGTFIACLFECFYKSLVLAV